MENIYSNNKYSYKKFFSLPLSSTSIGHRQCGSLPVTSEFPEDVLAKALVEALVDILENVDAPALVDALAQILDLSPTFKSAPCFLEHRIRASCLREIN